MAVDFLSLWEDDESDGRPEQQRASDLILVDGPATPADAGAEAALVPARSHYRARSRFPNMRGRVGKGRHGNVSERSLLACHMRHLFRKGIAFVSVLYYL